MSPFRAPFKSNSAEWSIPPQTRSNVRLAMVAGTVLITIFVLAMAAIEARRAERALAVAAAHTLRDYAGYAGRTMGGEVLRRFSEQRAMILSPVSGSANRDVPEPALEDIVARGQKYFETHHTPTSDLQLGYFRVDLRTKAVQSRGVMGPALAARICRRRVALHPTRDWVHRGACVANHERISTPCPSSDCNRTRAGPRAAPRFAPAGSARRTARR